MQINGSDNQNLTLIGPGVGSKRPYKDIYKLLIYKFNITVIPSSHFWEFCDIYWLGKYKYKKNL